MSLLNCKEDWPWARSIKGRVFRRQMPAWQIDRNVGINKFKDDASLIESEMATIAKWVDGVPPAGNPGCSLLSSAFRIRKTKKGPRLAPHLQRKDRKGLRLTRA